MVRLFVTYLEQRARPSGSAMPVPAAGLSLRWERFSSVEYLRLYTEIGAPVQWDDRLRMATPALEVFLRDPAALFFVLRERDLPVGLCEAVHAETNEIEITNFGVVPAAQGRGLGSFLLCRAVEELWRRNPNRLWLHTDTNDGRYAMRTYQRAGFEICRQDWETFPD
jgi:ribosomal protein S18 acetylase RimI-like enzyme